jgi:hypothetical protein
MKTANIVPLSIVPTTESFIHVTEQTLHTLQFIHRFRHVTTHHLQLCLRHASLGPTNKHLTRLRAKGYVARQYSSKDRANNRAASYHLTLDGLDFLKTHSPDVRLRRSRSVLADATMGIGLRSRCHTLADVYAHLKRHHDGHFECFSSFDIARLSYMPTEVPDGYIRMRLEDGSYQHYFIEIYGWNRSTALQARRLVSYQQFADDETWAVTDQPAPRLLIVAPSASTLKRLRAHLKQTRDASLAPSLSIYTAQSSQLWTAEATIWRQV